jgi:hypothetical protein
LAISSVTFTSLQKASPTANELISNLATRLEEDYTAGRISEALWAQYQIQLRRLRDEKAVDLEIILLPAVRLLQYAAEPLADLE